MNIAMTLRRFGRKPALLTAIGRDEEGEELLGACRRMGMVTDHVYRSDDLPTDRYMAVEGANGVIAAIADAHSLEAAGDKIIRPLRNGVIGDSASPFAGPIALDGNLTEELLTEIVADACFAKADLRVAPASPGKAERLLPLLGCPNATLYVNLEEAGLLAHRRFDTATEAAASLQDRGAARVLVTDGGRTAAEAGPTGLRQATPPEVLVTRVTGAGDTFMAAHIAAEADGADGQTALENALRAAADYVSGDVRS
jgi:sugar/nucleoside kinase (ribokinase family)